MGRTAYAETEEKEGEITMAFDYKKEYKEFYQPKKKPSMVEVPEMRYIAVRGEGNPNEEGGAYKEAIGLLYAIAFTIKMSKMGSYHIEGYFDYVVPPLEGFWWQEKTKKDFDWAILEATAKKKKDFSKVEFLTIEEGLCVQCMHIGDYDAEPETIALMDAYIAEQGYENDFAGGRLHHEIYLSDPRRVPPQRRKTVIRHPVKEKAMG